MNVPRTALISINRNKWIINSSIKGVASPTIISAGILISADGEEDSIPGVIGAVIINAGVSTTIREVIIKVISTNSSNIRDTIKGIISITINNSSSSNQVGSY